MEPDGSVTAARHLGTGGAGAGRPRDAGPARREPDAGIRMTDAGRADPGANGGKRAVTRPWSGAIRSGRDWTRQAGGNGHRSVQRRSMTGFPPPVPILREAA